VEGYVNLSAAGIAILKSEEGLSLKPYRDAGGYSIGYGHFIKPDESEFMVGIDQARADTLLIADVAWAVKAVNRYVTIALTQNQFDALVDFTYNVGETAFRRSTLLTLLNAGKLDAAADQFGRWNHANGVVNVALTARRAKEKALFQTA
jgi:lysozyme